MTDGQPQQNPHQVGAQHAVPLRWPDPGLLLALALSLLAAWSLLSRPSLPQGADMVIHVQRTAEFARLLAEGVLIPRWSPNLFYGYGYPVFNYYAPLSYYAASLLGGGDAVAGVRAVMVLSLLGSGAGAYLLARRLVDARGGVVAAAVYVYSPYLLLIEPYFRGAVPEMLGLALLPWLLWAFDRLLANRRAFDFALAALILAALLLAHNLMALVGGGMLAAWLLWAALLRRRTFPWRLALAVLLLGGGLAMCFWLPLVAERDAVRLNNLLIYDFEQYFRPFAELFAPSPILDLRAANPPYIYNLGVASWLLALGGAGWLGWRFFRRRRVGPFLATAGPLPYYLLAALLLIFLMHPASAFVWYALPPMPFLQFPWRLLGPAALCLAVLAAVCVRWLDLLPKGRAPAFALLTALPLLLAFPALVPPDWPADFGPTDSRSLINYEIETGIRGTSASDDFRPALVHVPPAPDDALLDSYASTVDKVNRAALPPGAEAETLSHSANEDVVRVQSDSAFTLVFNTFYWAGWGAELDGQPAAIVVSEPYGLIMVDVPAGDHTVRVYLGETPPRLAGLLITLGALVGLAAVIVWLWRRARSTPPEVVAPLVGRDAVAALLGGGVVVLLAALLLGQPGLFWLRSPLGEVQVAQNSFTRRLGQDIALLGFDVAQTTVQPGGTFEVVVYWQRLGPLDRDYHGFVHLRQPQSPLAGQADKQNPADYPTTRWPADRYIRDAYTVQVTPDAAPGEYLLWVGLWNCDDVPAEQCNEDDRLPVYGPDGELEGDSAILPVTITVQGG